MTRLFGSLIAFAALLTAVLMPTAAVAQTGNANAAPARGTQQRTAILNAVRPSVEARFGGRVEFVVNCLQVNNGWALANLDPQRPGGRAINPRTLPDWEHRDGLTVTAVLRFRNGRWNLVESAIGATDVWYEGIAPRPLQRSRCY